MKRTPMDEPTALRLLAPARTTREKIGSDGEFAPMVLFCPRRGPAAMAMLEYDTDLPAALAELLAEMRGTLGSARWIAVTTDAYAKPMPDPTGMEPGMLAQAFAEGDPTITEQIVVALKKRGEPLEVASQVYRYIPSEGWEWEEPMIVEQYGSGISEVLTKYI